MIVGPVPSPLDQGSQTKWVFVSHASEDEDVVRSLSVAIESAGLRCWVSIRSLEAGEYYAGQLLQAIGQAQAVVVVLSSSSNESPHVLREMEYGVSRGLPIVVFRIENVEPAGPLAYYLRTTHWMDAFEVPVADHYGSLVYTLLRLVGRTEGMTANDDRSSELLSELRRKLISAKSRNEVRDVRYEVEKLLSFTPHDTEALRLRDDAAQASSPVSSSPLSDPEAYGRGYETSSGGGWVWLVILGLLFLLAVWIFG